MATGKKAKHAARAETGAPGVADLPQVARPADVTPPGLGARLLWASGLVALVLACYAPALQFGFVYDDFPLILDQPAPQSLHDYSQIMTQGHWNHLPYYRPVSRLALGLERAAFGEHPAPYYAVNALMMAAIGVMLMALLRLPAFAAPPQVAFLAAALFALHPVAAETVHPASAGPETLLYAVFLLASVYAFLRAGRRWYVASLVLLALALLSKEQAIIAPALFLLADWLHLSADAPTGRSRQPHPWRRRYLPVFAVVLGYFLLRATFITAGKPARIAFAEHPDGPFLSLVYTLQSIFAPSLQLVYEPRTAAVWATWPQLALLTLVLAALWLPLRKTWPMMRKEAWFFAGWLLLAVLPTANWLVQETAFAERYVFLALAGAVGLLAVLATARWRHEAQRPWIAALGGVAVLLSAGLTVTRSADYRDNATFCRQWARTDPRAVLPIAFMGEVLARQGDYDGAIAVLRQRLTDDPRGTALLHMPLGKALAGKRDFKGAAMEFRAALQTGGDDGTAATHLADAMRQSGDTADAAQAYQQQAARDPGDPIAVMNLGVIAADAQKSDEAVALFKKALALEPTSTLERADRLNLRSKANYNIGRILAAQGKRAEAISAYEAAIALNPEYAYAQTNLAILYLDGGEANRAIPHLEAALKAKPDLTLARTTLERARRTAGQ